jgi:hypothetical protein
MCDDFDTPDPYAYGDPYVVVFGRRDQEGGERKVAFNAENRDKAFGFAVRMSADEKWGIKEIRERGVDVTKEFDKYFERNFG